MKRVVLVGGGHSHLEVVREFGARPAAGAGIVLIDPATHATYSGMVPGLIAGHYRFDDCHVDLARLAHQAGVAFVNQRVAGLDPVRKTLALDDGKTIEYDILSLDVGSTPPLADTVGAREHALSVKPFAAFSARWERLLAGVAGGEARNMIVVGGGAAGVELALAMRFRLQRDAPSAKISFGLVTAEDCVLPTHNARVRAAAERLLKERRIAVHTNAQVVRVEPASITLADGKALASDATIWATGSAAPEWFTATGLALDARGFLSVAATLRSVSHPDVFAAGDCATLAGHHYPKSGVYAVRQGPVLADNLRRALNGESLVHYRPQQRSLALISAGSRYAIASYGAFALEGRWVWRWKDHIDRKFMRRYRD